MSHIFQEPVAISKHLNIICASIALPYVGVVVDHCPLFKLEMCCGNMASTFLHVYLDDIGGIIRDWMS